MGFLSLVLHASLSQASFSSSLQQRQALGRLTAFWVIQGGDCVDALMKSSLRRSLGTSRRGGLLSGLPSAAKSTRQKNELRYYRGSRRTDFVIQTIRPSVPILALVHASHGTARLGAETESVSVLIFRRAGVHAAGDDLFACRWLWWSYVTRQVQR